MARPNANSRSGPTRQNHQPRRCASRQRRSTDLEHARQIGLLKLACIDTLGSALPGKTGQWARYAPWGEESLNSRQLLRAAQMRAFAPLCRKKRQSDRSSSKRSAQTRRPPAAGAGALTGMFDPSKIGQRQNASARVVAWAKDLPDTVEASAQITRRARHRRDARSHGSIRAQVKAAIRAVPDTVLINAGKCNAATEL